MPAYKHSNANTRPDRNIRQSRHAPRSTGPPPAAVQAIHAWQHS